MSGGYEVGKGKPPQKSRFKPGQSGNAKGRPRKAKPAAVPADSEFDKTLRERFDAPVSVKDGGKTKQVPMSEAVISSTLAVAAKGNPLAQRTALTLLQELELREAARQLAEEELDRKTVDYVRQVKAVQTKAWAEAEARGEKPARLYPHPDDIFISLDGLQWRCKGPWHVNEVPRFELYMTLCEVAYPLGE